MAKKEQQPVVNGSFETKTVSAAKAFNYSSFGWARSKNAAATEGGKGATVTLRRRLPYAQDGILRSYENEYMKREGKRYRQLPILGIICFLLMLVFLAVAGVELYYGISHGLEMKNPYGTYAFYDENGEKVEYPVLTLAAEGWTLQTTSSESSAKSGRLENAVTHYNLYFGTPASEEDEGDEVLLYVAVIDRGALTLQYQVKNDPQEVKYFSDKNKAAEKYSLPKVEEPESAPLNADDESEEEGDEEAPAKAGGINAVLDKVTGILDKVHDGYLTKVTEILDGKPAAAGEDEEGNFVPAQPANGFLAGLAKKIGAPIGCFLTGDVVLALVALILFIVVTCFFSAIAKKKAKRKANEARKAELLQRGRERVAQLQRTNPNLMNKSQRKMFMWETVLTNAFRNVGLGGSGGVDDEDDYDID